MENPVALGDDEGDRVRGGLYLPQPTYFFVTPKRPELAKRLTIGLSALVDSGALGEIFTKYHGDNLRRTRLAGRRIIKLKT